MTKEIQDLIKEEANNIFPINTGFEGERINRQIGYFTGATAYAGKMLEFIKWKDENCQDCGEDEWTIGPTGKVYTTSELLIKYLKK